MILGMIEKNETAAFSGHRIIPAEKVDETRAKVRREIMALYAKGVHVFLNGMALGFDMLAAEEVIALRKEFPYIKLIAVVPFRNQSIKWGTEEKSRWWNILLQADENIFLSEYYFDRCFLKRNDYMVERAGRLVCYFNGRPYGGTAYTYRMAKKKNMLISNLY